MEEFYCCQKGKRKQDEGLIHETKTDHSIAHSSATSLFHHIL